MEKDQAELAEKSNKVFPIIGRKKVITENENNFSRFSWKNTETSLQVT